MYHIRWSTSLYMDRLCLHRGICRRHLCPACLSLITLTTSLLIYLICSLEGIQGDLFNLQQLKHIPNRDCNNNYNRNNFKSVDVKWITCHFRWWQLLWDILRIWISTIIRTKIKYFINDENTSFYPLFYRLWQRKELL